MESKQEHRQKHKRQQPTDFVTTVAKLGSQAVDQRTKPDERNDGGDEDQEAQKHRGGEGIHWCETGRLTCRNKTGTETLEARPEIRPKTWNETPGLASS